MIDITEKDGAVTFRVRVVPRASRTEIAGELDGALKIRIASPPVDGAANEELIKFLAKQLGVSKSDVEIAGGKNSKSKSIRVRNVASDAVAKAINLIDPKIP
ncbi:MAG: YggU family protein [Acidobacteria bacterium]|nr:YggU family protein [Acidobacteriota bacterium]MBK8150782.1 YggU family protein [Acidobacteriota bacterium]MBK8812221.1 YggU family protein [Acidobacteriota bacterium]